MRAKDVPGGRLFSWRKVVSLSMFLLTCPTTLCARSNSLVAWSSPHASAPFTTLGPGAVVGLCQILLLPMASSHATYDHPDIVDMNASTIYEYLQNSPTAWIVEFYTTWCGYCNRFAPTWRRLALLTKGWKRIIRLGALDCGDRSTVHVCRKYDIQLYPNVRFFPPGLKDAAEESGLVYPDVVADDEVEISNAMMDFVADIRDRFDRTDFPYLEVTTGQEALANEYLSTILIFEDTNSNATRGSKDRKTADVAKRTIMEATKYFGVGVHRLSIDDPVAKDYGIRKAPSVLLCVNNGTNCRLLEGKLLPPTEILERLYLFTEEMGMPIQRFQFPTEDHGEPEDRAGELPPEPTPNEIRGEDFKSPIYEEPVQTSEALSAPTKQSQDGEERKGKRKKPHQRRVYLKDLDNAVGYALRHEVALNRVIEGKKGTALRAFVAALVKYYPGKPKAVDALESVLNWIKAQEGGKITYDAWESLMKYVSSKKELALPEEGKYVGCLGSDPRYRGYPCGLWMLFHTLLMEAHEEENGDPRLVLRAIFGYVRNFFGCEYCRRHFDEMAKEDGLLAVRNKTEAVLWLWRAHNKVNNRLRGDETEDPEHPKVDFPPPELCPKCKRDASSIPGGSETFIIESTLSETWDEVEVLQFLRWFYMLSDDPLVVNVRTNVSDEERARVQANWPGLRSRKKPRLQLPPHGLQPSSGENEIADQGRSKGGNQRSLENQRDGEEGSGANIRPTSLPVFPAFFAFCLLIIVYFD